MLGNEVGAEHEHDADQRTGDQRETAGAEHPAGDRGRDEGDEGERTDHGGSNRHQCDREQQNQHAGALRAHPEAARSVVSELQHTQAGRDHADEWEQHEQCRRNDRDVAPGSAPEPADQPHQRLLHFAHVATRDQVIQYGLHHECHSDTDQYEPKTRDAAAPGEQVDSGCHDQRPEERDQRDGGSRQPEHEDGERR